MNERTSVMLAQEVSVRHRERDDVLAREFGERLGLGEAYRDALLRYVAGLRSFVTAAHVQGLGALHGPDVLTELCHAIFGENPYWTLHFRRLPARRILLVGETGVGKEYVAGMVASVLAACSNSRSVHVVNLAAGSANLVSDVLFGHVKGAFTGATGDRRGAVAQVEGGGCLVLDEVTEAPEEVQVKLLRLLERGDFQREGHDKVHNAYFHVIACTNRSEADMRDGSSLRRDLYFRLAAPPIRLPPLRERLAVASAAGPEHTLTRTVCDMMERIVTEMGEPIDERAGDWRSEFLNGHARIIAIEMLGYAWPGNYRELANLIRRVVGVGLPRAAAACKDWRRQHERTRAGPAHVGEHLEVPVNLHAVLREVRRRYLHAALAGGVTDEVAARKLGLTRQTVGRWKDELKIE